jgi:hypothetical protein
MDKIDARGLLDAVGYTGADPFGAGYLSLRDNGMGDTLVFFDRDLSGPNPEWPNYILRVENVAPAQLGSGNWIFQ